MAAVARMQLKKEEESQASIQNTLAYRGRLRNTRHAATGTGMNDS